MEHRTARAVKKPVSSPKTPDALLAAAMRAQGDGVVISAASARPPLTFRIVFANDSFCAMTGRPLAELVHQRHATLHADRGDIARFARAPHAGPPFSGEGYLLLEDGSTLYATWSFSLIRNRRGRPTHLIASYRDTTEKRRLQEALVHAQRLDAVGRLAGGVAHDFNNLIAIINGFCEMLAAHIADRPQALREVNEIHQAGLRAAALTRQLLAFGRRQPMDARIMNFNDLARNNAEIVVRLLGSSGRLELDLAPDLHNVRADPTQFQQVLLNLLINARDALRDHGCVTLSTANREIKPGRNRRISDVPPGRYVCLSVTDNGTGMDAETQKHLFEPFFTTKPEGKGTGLGLALVYGVVQQSSGYINVRSALLAGTTVEILLPEVQEPVEQDAAVVPISPLPETRGHETLLVVEDNDVVRRMLAGMLTTDGYHVLAAKTTKAMLALAREQPRPVQLLIAVAEKGTAAAVRTLRARWPDLRVLLVGNLDVPSPLAGLAPSHQTGLAKPYALSEILRRVRMLLDA
jgi:PAS domain S-box-containing protein